MLLNGTTHKIQVTTGGAVASPGVDISADYADLVSGAVSVAPATNQNVTTAATFDIFAGISTGQRKLKRMAISNRHASTSVAVTPKFTDGSIVVALFPAATLAPGESLTYQEGVGWCHFDSNGALYSVGGSGRLLGTTVLTSGTTFTTTSQTKSIRVRGVGGGGGGGGCTSVASAAAGGGGGGAGSYGEKVFAVTPSTAYTYAIGGSGVGQSGLGGTTGGTTTFTVGGVTLSMPGGIGGTVGTASAAVTVVLGGDGGAQTSGGDINGKGAPGEPGFVTLVATPVGWGGNGASGEFGGGGQGRNSVGNGNNAGGFGAGGGGALTGASTVRTGGGGSAGLIIVQEYS